ERAERGRNVSPHGTLLISDLDDWGRGLERAESLSRRAAALYCWRSPCVTDLRPRRIPYAALSRMLSIMAVSPIVAARAATYDALHVVTRAAHEHRAGVTGPGQHLHRAAVDSVCPEPHGRARHPRDGRLPDRSSAPGALGTATAFRT